MKKYFLLLILFCVTSVFGQMSFTPPPMPKMNMHNDLMFMNYSSNPTYRCEIYLNNGSIVEGESGLFKNVDGEFYLKIKKEKYFPSNTDSVYVNQTYGFPKGNHWMFKTITGKLSVFNKYPINDLNKNCIIKKNSRESVPYSSTNLKIEIEDNPDALALFNSIQKKKLISNSISFGGIGIMLGGLVFLPKGGHFTELPEGRIIIAGGIISLCGLLLKSTYDKTHFDVVKKYNE